MDSSCYGVYQFVFYWPRATGHFANKAQCIGAMPYGKPRFLRGTYTAYFYFAGHKKTSAI